MRKNKIHLDKVLASLNTECTNCGYQIPPAEMRRPGFDTVQCPKCEAVFVPGRKV
jgi:ribosomal protein S27AE